MPKDTLYVIPYADIKAGDVLIADGGFTCLADGEVVTVLGNSHETFCVACLAGLHYLEGQLDHDTQTQLIGFKRKELTA